MPLSKLNLIIVDRDLHSIKLLRNYLSLRFNDEVNVASFYNSASALKKITFNTNLIILEHHLYVTKERQFSALTKKINPKTKVIQRTSNEAVASAVEKLNFNAMKMENNAFSNRNTFLQIKNLFHFKWNKN